MIEDKYTEFKREYTDDIKYAVIAFANTLGGKILIGINDDASVYGISDVDDVCTRITNMLRDSISPDVMMFVDIQVHISEHKSVIEIKVQRGTARPYYLRTKGVRPEGVYVRQGPSSVPATMTAIVNMIKETSGDHYEESRSINQDLTFNKANDYFASSQVLFGPLQKKTLGIISADSTYTNLGMLLSDQSTPSIKVAVFDGSEKSNFRDRREFTGSLLRQVEEAYEYIQQFNRLKAEFNELKRIDTRDYPTEALREALLNAIVHRDYSLSSSILISLFDDRMEFVSFGGLVNGVAFDDIMIGLSALRNPKLANIFYRLHLIESYGTGILKIKECYRNEEQKPKFEVSSHAFKITLPNRNFQKEDQLKAKGYFQENDEQAQAVLMLLESKETISRQDVDDMLGISQTSASMLLKRLISTGYIIKVRQGRLIRYKKAGKVA